MVIDLKAFKTSFLFVNKVLLLLVTYLDERRTGDEVMVVVATVDASKLLQLRLLLLLREGQTRVGWSSCFLLSTFGIKNGDACFCRT